MDTECFKKCGVKDEGRKGRVPPCVCVCVLLLCVSLFGYESVIPAGARQPQYRCNQCKPRC